MNRLCHKLLVVILTLILAGCVSRANQAGVENLWRANADNFIVEKTTQADVLKLLGPPSQIIQLADRQVFYYLLEKTRGRTSIYIVYNRIVSTTTYDRAVFFFNESGVLEQFSFSLPED